MICVTCGQNFEGNYCPNCGEKVIDQKDRTVFHFFSEVVKAFTFVETKLWRTLRLMVLRPGKFALDYSRGIRQPYMRPVSLFFLANFIYFLFPIFEIFTTPLAAQTKYFFYSDYAGRKIEQKLEKEDLDRSSYAAVYDEKTAELSKLLLILFVFLLSGFAGLLYLNSGRLYADHLLFSFEFFTFGLIYLVNLLALILSALIYVMRWVGIDLLFLVQNERYLILPIIACSIIYFSFRSSRVFYGASKGHAAWKSIALLASFVICLDLYRFILFHITLWLT